MNESAKRYLIAENTVAEVTGGAKLHAVLSSYYAVTNGWQIAISVVIRASNARTWAAPGVDDGGTTVVSAYRREASYRRAQDLHPFNADGAAAALRLIALPGFAMSHRITRRASTLLIEVDRDSDLAGQATVVLRVLRELFLETRAAQTELLTVHGACIRRRIGGCLILGPKRAGKTTLALSGCVGGRGVLVANDRTLVSALPAASVITCHGVPMGIRIHTNLARIIDGLRPYALGESQPVRPRICDPDAEEKFELGPMELNAAIGSRSEFSTQLDHLIVADLHEDAPEVRVKSVSPGDLASCLRGDPLFDMPWPERWLSTALPMAHAAAGLDIFANTRCWIVRYANRQVAAGTVWDDVDHALGSR